MPHYDFVCTECSTAFELILPMAEYNKPTTEPCPKCGLTKIEQVLGANPCIDSVNLGIRKPDREFQREILGRMKKQIPKNRIGQSGRFDIPGRV